MASQVVPVNISDAVCRAELDLRAISIHTGAGLSHPANLVSITAAQGSVTCQFSPVSVFRLKRPHRSTP